MANVTMILGVRSLLIIALAGLLCGRVRSVLLVGNSSIQSTPCVQVFLLRHFVPWRTGFSKNPPENLQETSRPVFRSSCSKITYKPVLPATNAIYLLPFVTHTHTHNILCVTHILCHTHIPLQAKQDMLATAGINANSIAQSGDSLGALPATVQLLVSVYLCAYMYVCVCVFIRVCTCVRVSRRLACHRSASR